MAGPIDPKDEHRIAAADAIDDAPLMYQPKDAIAELYRSATITGGAGLFIAAVQNSMLRENVGAFGIFTRFGNTIALFGIHISPKRAEYCG